MFSTVPTHVPPPGTESGSHGKDHKDWIEL